MGDNINIVYTMKDGVPIRQTTTVDDRLLSLLRQKPGVSKKDFESIAMEHGFKRATVREFLDRALFARTISYTHADGLAVIESIAA